MKPYNIFYISRQKNLKFWKKDAGRFFFCFLLFGVLLNIYHELVELFFLL